MADSGLKAIFLAQRPMLLRLLTARLGGRDEAEDALQDLWLRIDQTSDQPIAQPAAFLYRMASNLATDRRIAAGRRGARDGGWLDVQPGAEEMPDPERASIARGQWREVEGAIADMPERMATALRMFRLEERPQRDIAEHLGISVSGVEKLLQRAYRKIHDRLAASGEALGDARRLEDERGAES
ncbi:RNA polymerase sigma factor [Sphingomonas bacterium]|uniref:RNA polymerase sigma factor n=1 Tax=Sphingomonas bacterium TaxID=1895847 RepID=UPI002618E469|nr:RNA polymerase sigma factor [Sphingomonas bacterium]MDB5678956.1 polymerase sigma factor [Sphingomonas bacterium]